MNKFINFFTKLGAIATILASLPISQIAYASDDLVIKEHLLVEYEDENLEIYEHYSSSPNQYREDVFNPFDDERLNVNFCINTPAYVSVNIYKTHGDDWSKVKELKDKKYYNAGCYSTKWDGEYKNSDLGDNYDIVEPGKYYYGINAQNAVNLDDKEYKSQWIYVTEDHYKPYVDEKDYCGGYYDVYYDYEYCDAIKWANNYNIFGGYYDGYFKPNQTISRVEALKAVITATNGTTTTTTTTTSTYSYYHSYFNDINYNAWYTPYIYTGLDYGIINGSNGYFYPHNNVNKVEALKMLFESAHQINNFQLPVGFESNPYYDVTYTTHTEWYIKYVSSAKRYGLTTDQYYFNPQSDMTRAEFAYMLYKFYNS